MWKPIETAPKDQTHILLLIEDWAIEGYWDRRRRIDRHYVANAPRTWPMSRDWVTGVIVRDTQADQRGFGHVFLLHLGSHKACILADSEDY
jgi:hypothetical protein